MHSQRSYVQRVGSQTSTNSFPKLPPATPIYAKATRPRQSYEWPNYSAKQCSQASKQNLPMPFSDLFLERDGRLVRVSQVVAQPDAAVVQLRLGAAPLGPE